MPKKRDVEREIQRKIVIEGQTRRDGTYVFVFIPVMRDSTYMYRKIQEESMPLESQ